MKHSTERILKTHTGSLPRPEGLAQLMIVKEQGKAIDVKELADNVRTAVAEVVRQQVDVGRENVIAGTDCGFGTFLGTGVIAPSVAWDKLRSLAEGARLASGELW